MIHYIQETREVTENVLDEIMAWFDSKDRILNILSLPYEKPDLFIPVIRREINNKGNVLYIAATEKGYRSLLDSINAKEKNSYCIYDGTNGDMVNPSNFVITDHKNALFLEKTFNLVIYDEVTDYSTYNKYEIMDILAKYYKNKSRVISRSSEIVLKNAKIVEILFDKKRAPLSEPRILETRLDLDREIPYIMYEYLQWSVARGKDIIIFTPSKQKSSIVLSWIHEVSHNLKANILKIDSADELNELNSRLKLSNNIIITNSLKLLALDKDNMDFVVYDSENRVFDYKKLVYICAKATKNPEKENGEVIFLSRNVSRDMEECKNLIRDFNKKAWEKGLVNI